MADSTLSSLSTTATALSSLVLVTPNTYRGYSPQAKQLRGQKPVENPKPLLFHYEGENTFSQESSITDHFLEDNTAVQDHISLKPEVVTVTGFIGELNNVPQNPVLAGLKQIAEKLTAIGAYTPVLSATAIREYNKAAFLYSAATKAFDTGVEAWSTISGGNDIQQTSTGAFVNKIQNNQQKTFNQFYGYQRDRTLFTIQTPWALFTDMAIQSFRSIQTEETDMVSNFEITFKKMRFATTTLISFNARDYQQGRLASQAADVTDLGVSAPVPSDPLSTRLPR